MTVQTDDVLAVTVIHDNTVSGEMVNRFQFQLVGGGPVDDADVLDDIADVVETIYTILAALLSFRNVLREVGVYNLTQDVLLGTTMPPTYTGGTLTGDDQPQGACPYTYFKTVVPRVVLSKYWPNTTGLAVTLDGGLNPGTVSTIATAATLLLAPIVVNGRSYQYGYNSPKTLSFVVPVSTVTRNVQAYQRRRKPGRGS